MYNDGRDQGKTMENRITDFMEEERKDAQPISEILEELFAQYETRFPGIRIAVVETPVNAI
jgi:hypothetical protein